MTWRHTIAKLRDAGLINLYAEHAGLGIGAALADAGLLVDPRPERGGGITFQCADGADRRTCIQLSASGRILGCETSPGTAIARVRAELEVREGA